jgi:hypothetical protein
MRHYREFFLKISRFAFLHPYNIKTKMELRHLEHQIRTMIKKAKGDLEGKATEMLSVVVLNIVMLNVFILCSFL